MFRFPLVKVSKLEQPVIGVGGGMGACLSLEPIASAMAREGGVGTISSVAIDWLYSQRKGREIDQATACKEEVKKTIELASGRGAVAINLMAALQGSYLPSINGAVAGGVHAIVVGAGLPLLLPSQVKQACEACGRVDLPALIPIVSSARVLRAICEKWARQDGAVPDAVILEGPLAGGHLGFKNKEALVDPANSLENLLLEVLGVAASYSEIPIPVIVAGGIWDATDIRRLVGLGASGFQAATAFLTTVEINSTPEVKGLVAEAQEDDIVVMPYKEGQMSPSGMLFRALRNSPGFPSGKKCPVACLGYMKDPATGVCKALADPQKYCGICPLMLAGVPGGDSVYDQPIVTVGTNAYRVDGSMTTVHDVVTQQFEVTGPA